MKTRLFSSFAPGRVELLGEHTDYNEGVVLGAAIERGLTIRGAPRSDGRIVLASEKMGRLEIAASRLRPLRENRWANYVLGVARELPFPATGFAARSSCRLRAGELRGARTGDGVVPPQDA